MKNEDNMENKTLDKAVGIEEEVSKSETKGSVNEALDDAVGIEDATASESEGNEPFDPKSISLNTRTITLETIIRRLRQNTLLLNPDFQRKEVWNLKAKSRLIESIMLRIPIPMFYLSSDVNNVYTVIDGQQRLSAIRDFIIGYPVNENPTDKWDSKSSKDDSAQTLKLVDLEYLTQFNDKTFDELPIEYSNRILETEFTAAIIEPNTPEEVKRNVFNRINTGGLPLSQQEIRNALYAGEATKLLKDLASDDTFSLATDHSIKAMRADDQEIVLRLISFFVREPSRYSSNDMDAWLSDTMQIINASSGQRSKDITRKLAAGEILESDITNISGDRLTAFFRTGMIRSHKLFGKYAFRKNFSGSRKKIVKALFEMWGYILARLSENEFDRLLASREKFLAEYESIMNRTDFSMRISKNSTKSNDLKNRFKELSELTENYIA